MPRLVMDQTWTVSLQQLRLVFRLVRRFLEFRRVGSRGTILSTVDARSKLRATRLLGKNVKKKVW